VDWPECGCGCGEPAAAAPKTRSERGWVRGEPLRFAAGHYSPARPEYRVDEESGCWLWLRKRSSSGYGMVRKEAGSVRAHRQAYIDRCGPIPPGFDVHHRCGVPRCVNPDHLVLVGHDAHSSLGRPRGWVPAEEYRRVLRLLVQAGGDPKAALSQASPESQLMAGAS
jgi:hypothetical protein